MRTKSGSLVKRIRQTEIRLLKKQWLRLRRAPASFAEDTNSSLPPLHVRSGDVVPDVQVINTTKEDLKAILDIIPDGIEPQLIIDGKLMQAYDVDRRYRLYSRENGIKIMDKDGTPLIIVDDIEVSR